MTSSVRFSGRLEFETGENRLTRMVADLRARGRAVIDATISNPTVAGFRVSPAALGAALCESGIENYTPDPFGPLRARRAIADVYAEDGIVVDPDDIVLTASSSESYDFLFKLLCDPGSVVAIPRPSYPLFDHLAGLDAVRTEPYRLVFDGEWSIDFDALAVATRSDCRAVLAVNPNNPTGSFLRRADLARLGQHCAERGLPIIVDEVFADYPLSPRSDAVQRVLSEPHAGLVVALGGLSKSCGLPQLKLGWLVLAGPADQRAAARRRLELIADTMLSVGTPVALGLPQLFTLGRANRAAIRDRIRINRDSLISALDGTAASPLPIEGGWSAVVRVPSAKSDEAWALDLLERSSVLLQPGYLFDFDEVLAGSYLVLSLLVEPTTFMAAVSALREAVTTPAG